jgi:hypothetical protein
MCSHERAIVNVKNWRADGHAMGENTSPGNIIWPSLFALIEIYSVRETLRIICVLKTVRVTGIDQLEVKWNGEDAF